MIEYTQDPQDAGKQAQQQHYQAPLRLVHGHEIVHGHISGMSNSRLAGEPCHTILARLRRRVEDFAQDLLAEKLQRKQNYGTGVPWRMDCLPEQIAGRFSLPSRQPVNLAPNKGGFAYHSKGVSLQLRD